MCGHSDVQPLSKLLLLFFFFLQERVDDEGGDGPISCHRNNCTVENGHWRNDLRQTDREAVWLCWTKKPTNKWHINSYDSYQKPVYMYCTFLNEYYCKRPSFTNRFHSSTRIRLHFKGILLDAFGPSINMKTIKTVTVNARCWKRLPKWIGF